MNSLREAIKKLSVGNDEIAFYSIQSYFAFLFSLDLILKRVLDLAIVSISLPLLLPVFLLIACVIKIDSRGKVIFKSPRIGKDWQEFTMFKFRTMLEGAEQVLEENPTLDQEFHVSFKLKEDPRTTGVGKFLRRTCLDELPQLFNVLRGEMSIVGPRPILKEEKNHVSEARFFVKPGMTGLWQISGKSVLSYQKKNTLDDFYASHRNLFFDLIIIFHTIPAIINGKGFYAALLFFLLCSAPPLSLAQSSRNNLVEKTNIEISKDWLYVEGEKFFVKGICFFENHDVEGEFRRSSPEILDYEFQRIKEAGFNTIRSQLTPSEIALAKKHGLMVLQGANHLFFSNEYQNSERLANEVKTIKRIVRGSKRYDNSILYYLIDNEPQIQEGIYRQGEGSFKTFHETLIQTVKEEHPGALVSMASYPPAAFLDHSLYNPVSLNLYPSCTACESLGYAGYVHWFKDRHAKDKPLIISEYGWEVARPEEEMAQAMIDLLEEQIQGGATGSFFYTWRAFGKEASGDNLWYGMIPNQAKEEDYKNLPREIYHALRQYFQALVIEPREKAIYHGEIPVQVYGTDETASMVTFLNQQSVPLEKKGRFWWEGRILIKDNISGSQILSVVAKDREGNMLVEKKRHIAVRGGPPETFKVSITPQETFLQKGESYRAKILVTSPSGEPVANAALKFAINQTGASLWTSEHFIANTDIRGEYQLTWPSLVPGYFTLMATLDGAISDLQIQPDVDSVRVGKD